MSQTERLYRLKSLLDAGRIVRRDEIVRTLEISEATLKRDIAYLRDRLGAPIVYDRSAGGWHLDGSTAPREAARELPGLWMNAREIHALMTMRQLLADLDAGDLLAPHLEPLLARLEGLLAAGSEAPVELPRRIRLVPLASRRVAPQAFQALGSALLRRRRVVIRYRGRTRDEETLREVSPQRMLYYRDNWYLEAWCHLRAAMRTFSVDAVLSVTPAETAALEVSQAELDAAVGRGYGIFAGREVEWATLRFSPARSRWVASERWHPNQEGELEADGSWRLHLPFADPRELAMDVLRYIPDVTVVGPASLKELVEARVRAAARQID